MIVGVGVDLSSVARMAALLERHPGVAERLDVAGALLSPEALAVRFAAKEAFIKALGGAVSGARWRDVTVTHDTHGAPSLQFAGAISDEVKRRGIDRCQLSLSHDAGLAIAVVILESDGLPSQQE
ncbi:MAG: holo-ACP synthase [Propionibacteriaceae bacterium]|jgi:holo-[acyl-carrier protein] synthase|nr:holo-ACP synthase [Propionibacteriaceae bacterium]